MFSFPFVEHRPAGMTPPTDNHVDWNAAPAALPSPASRPDESEFPDDLTVVSTRHLRVLCNQTYRQLDRDFPPAEAIYQYEELVREIERREVQAESNVPPVRVRTGFRDNALFSRFELFSDGTMVGHVKYELKSSYAVLIQAVVDPRFDPTDVEPALIRQVMLNAHRRRISVVPYCPRVRNFLREFPQYRTLLTPEQRKRLDSVRVSVPED